MFSLALHITFGLLALAAVLASVRVAFAPSLADRMVALDLLVVVALIAIAADAARRGSSVFLDVMVVVALVGFLATVAVARFIERRGAR